MDEMRGFDPTDLASIRSRADQMRNRTLRDLADELGYNLGKPGDKGWAGKVIHYWFIDDDTMPEPDLRDVLHPTNSHKGLEIKAVPLKGGKSKEWLVKEPMSLALIDYHSIHESDSITPIEESVIFRKDRWTLVVYYEHNFDDRAEGKVEGLAEWLLDDFLFSQIKSDYGTIIDFINKGLACDLSETLTEVLSPRTKASSASDLRSGGEGRPPAKPRCWALKAAYIREQLGRDSPGWNKPLSERYGSTEVEEDGKRIEPIDSINQYTRWRESKMVEHFKKVATGKTVREVAEAFQVEKLGGLDPHARVARVALHHREGGLGNDGNRRATYVDGCLVKVVRLNPAGMPQEDTPLVHVPLKELVEQEWDGSGVQQNLYKVLFIPMTDAEELVDCIYLNPFVWRPDSSDWDILEQEWRMIREAVEEGKAVRNSGGKKSQDDLPKASETTALHVRPKGQDRTTVELDHEGRECTRQTLWLNREFVAKIIQNHEHISVVELFAGVGGFRIGLEGEPDSKGKKSEFCVIWSNQWEPSTKVQHASDIYASQWNLNQKVGSEPVYHSEEGRDIHVNDDIAEVTDIPEHNLLCGGFPCQDYSVAKTLNTAKGLVGKKGVLWWEIYRFLGYKLPAFALLENVDRLLKSPSSQRGRDFAVMLASLDDLGYVVEWRVVDASEYGFSQRRKRVFILAHGPGTAGHSALTDDDASPQDWIEKEGVLAEALPIKRLGVIAMPQVELGWQGEWDRLARISDDFNSHKAGAPSPFENAGVMVDGMVYTARSRPAYAGPRATLGDILVETEDVPPEFLLDADSLLREKGWIYLKGAKKQERTTAEGFTYPYNEGPVTFPDRLDKPSRTIVTGEGGRGPSRFKHVIKFNPTQEMIEEHELESTECGEVRERLDLGEDEWLRRLVPLELERLNGFPDNHTEGVSDGKRAFLMGNALVVGIIERIATALRRQNELGNPLHPDDGR